VNATLTPARSVAGGGAVVVVGFVVLGVVDIGAGDVGTGVDGLVSLRLSELLHAVPISIRAAIDRTRKRGPTALQSTGGIARTLRGR
jgi:hypothetical protein